MIKQGRIVSDNLTVSITKVPIVLSGWTDFDGKVNYRLRGESVIERLPAKARELLADLSIDSKQRQVLMQANKNGFFYVLDRQTGEFL